MRKSVYDAAVADYEAEILQLEDKLARQTVNACAPTTSQPAELDRRVAVAALAVAHMVENHAETMAVKAGQDVADYIRFSEDVHALRAAVGRSIYLDDEAKALYEQLTTAF